MRRGVPAVVVLILLRLLPVAAAADWQTGDIIFQVTDSSQCRAIQIATRSPFSHVGMIVAENGSVLVAEAVGPVKMTSLADWIAHGENGDYVVKRLADTTPLNRPGARRKLVDAVNVYMGRPYDFYFEWKDNALYCSELVWKAYDQALNITLCPLRKMRSFDLSHPVVKAKLQERYGENVPLDEPVVAPAGLFDSPLLITVESKLRLPAP